MRVSKNAKEKEADNIRLERITACPADLRINTYKISGSPSGGDNLLLLIIGKTCPLDTLTSSQCHCTLPQGAQAPTPTIDDRRQRPLDQRVQTKNDQLREGAMLVAEGIHWLALLSPVRNNTRPALAKDPLCPALPACAVEPPSSDLGIVSIAARRSPMNSREAPGGTRNREGIMRRLHCTFRDDTQEKN